MSPIKIQKAIDIADEFKNFCACYEGNELWGARDSHVPAVTLLEFMIANPELQDVANKIRDLDKI